VSTENPPVEQTLSWEAEKRPRAATIAVAGGLLTLLGNVLLTLLTNGGPTEDEGFISVTEALQARIAGQDPEGPSLVVRQIDHWGDNAPLLGVSTLLNCIAAVCLALTVLFLYRATYARSTQVGRVPYYGALAGLVLYPLGRAIRELAQWIGSANFEDEAVRTAGTARDVLSTGAVSVGSLIEVLGTFALAVAIVLVALNAMRVGLLTRFFGVLGILAGVLTVFQADQPGIVRSFWLIGVGLVIAGRLNTPPAWQSGRAEPWPTQQQLREQREAAQGDRAGRVTRDDDGDETAVEAEGPKPAHARKKRKRRR
jgi:hypothetical protein